MRIFLTLAFGLAFGIEGMTLVRSFLLDDESPEQVEKKVAENSRPVLREGDPLVPSTTPTIRVQRLRLLADAQAWTFTLVVHPDSLSKGPYTLTFDQLETSGGSTLTTAPSRTWTPGDTASFRASWSLPVGEQPTLLTLTATTEVTPDSTATTTRTVDLGHVPVRMSPD